MESLQNFWQKLKTSAQNLLKKMEAHRQLTAIIAILTVSLLLICFLIVPKIHQHIQAQEVEALVGSDYQTKKVTTIVPQKIQPLLKKENKVMILFVSPKTSLYKTFVKLLQKPNYLQAFDGKVYLVPLIYQQEKLIKTYRLKEKAITVLYFENQKEQARAELLQEKSLKVDLLKALNGLPMENIQQVKPAS